MKYIIGLFIFSLCLGCKPTKKESNPSPNAAEITIVNPVDTSGYVMKIYKDFNEMTLKGIGEIDDVSATLPYVELYSNSEQNLVYFKAHHTNGKVYTRHFKTRLGVPSTHHTVPMSRGLKAHLFTFYVNDSTHLVFSYDSSNPYINEKADLMAISVLSQKDAVTKVQNTFYPQEVLYGTPSTLDISQLLKDINQYPDDVLTTTLSDKEECFVQESFTDGERTFVSDEPYCIGFEELTPFWKHLERYETTNIYLEE